MNYLILIYQGTTPTPPSPEWDALPEEQKQAVYAGYQAVNATPGVTPGQQMAGPATATTVQVADGRALVTDGPFVESKEFLAGFWIIEAPDLDAALKLAAEGSKACNRKVEVRPFL